MAIYHLEAKVISRDAGEFIVTLLTEPNRQIKADNALLKTDETAIQAIFQNKGRYKMDIQRIQHLTKGEKSYFNFIFAKATQSFNANRRIYKD